MPAVTQPPGGPGRWQPDGGGYQPGPGGGYEPTAALPGQPGYGGGSGYGQGGYGSGGPGQGYGQGGYGPGGYGPTPGPPQRGGPPGWVYAAVAAVLVVGIVAVVAVLVGRSDEPSTAVASATSTSATSPASTSTSTSTSRAPTSTRESSPTRTTSPRTTTAGGLPTAGAGAAVRYEVTGTATDVSLVYSDAAGQVQTVEQQALPFTLDFTTTSSLGFTSLTATGSDGTLSCKVTVDGAVVAEESDDGIIVLALCTGF